MGNWDFSWERYGQQINLPEFGYLAQERLRQSKVLVVGAGGIGCPLLMYLCSMGVGHITVVDGDRVELSNLHRQVLYNEDDVGQLKVHVVKQKLLRLNPDVQVRALDVFLTPENAYKLCTGHDVILEGTDHPGVRLLCDDVSQSMGIPYVYGSIYQMQAQVAVFNYVGSLSYRDFFDISQEQTFILPSCSGEGVLPAVAGMVGSLMAGECVKLLTRIGEPLINGILVIDIKNNQFIRFVKDRKSPVEGFHHSAKPSEIKTISSTQLQEWLERKVVFQLLDVREHFEREVFSIGGDHIPYSQFRREDIKKFKPDVPLVVYCEHGIRSAHIVQLFVGVGFDQVYSLSGGAHAFRLMHKIV
jgi:adenylyltransferase/sulfurtransferase